ncbi:MAG TPA: hypothetical protein ENG42_01760 [Candidatus Aenigmarchaeota archaeon]|nr:MAG: hypothetical protein DRP03_00185 [Candidatus Aenigmarchaeota archaeon]HDD46175.1 hypothetical protein [Candidatus Aenigmarchaeota archaeon]
MRISLELIVVAIVILITALVVITIFGIGIQRASTLSEASNICKQHAAAACSVIGDGELPSTVTDLKIIVNDKEETCSDLLKGCKCSNRKLVC